MGKFMFLSFIQFVRISLVNYCYHTTLLFLIQQFLMKEKQPRFPLENELVITGNNRIIYENLDRC